MMKRAGWVLAPFMAATLASAAQAQDSAAVQAALAAYKPQHDTCFSGTSMAEDGQNARVRGAAITACDTYAAGVERMIADMNLSDVDKGYPMSLAADAMRVKGSLQIEGGDAEAGLATLVTEVMKLVRFTASSRQGLAIALSSGLQVETAIQLYKVGRGDEADSVVTNMRGVMDRYAEAYAGRPGAEVLLRRISQQGGYSEKILADDLPQGEWTGEEWRRRRLDAYLRAERWRFQRQALGALDWASGNLRLNVTGDRRVMAYLQDELGDRAAADMSFAASMVAGCARGEYPVIDKSEAARAAIRTCILANPDLTYGAAFDLANKQMAISSAGSIAERGAPYLDRAIDQLGPTASQAVPPQ